MSEPQPGGGLVQNLPKIKKQSTKENVRNVAVKSRDAQDILSTVQHSYLDSQYSCWEIASVRLINNKELDEQYRTKRGELKEDGRHTRDVQDQFAFLLVKDDKVINQICQYGLCARESSFNALGNSKMGVHVCRHADVQLRLAEMWGLDTCNIVILKVILGKCKVLSTQGNSSDNVEPTPNFDCHVSNTKPTVKDSVAVQAARSQIFLYEYNEDCETVERPRHCIPHAIVAYNRNSSRTIEQKAKGYMSEKSSGYSRPVIRIGDNARSSRPTPRSLLQSDVHLLPAAVTLARQPSWPSRILTEGEQGQKPGRIHQRSFSNETNLPAGYRIGQDQQMPSGPGLDNVDVYQTRKDPRVRRNSAQELEELSAHDVDLRPNRGASQDFDGRIVQSTDYNHGHFITNQSNLITDRSLDWFNNSAESDISFSSQDVDYRKLYRSQAEQLLSSGSDSNFEAYSTAGHRLSQGSALSDPRLNRIQAKCVSSDSQPSEEGQTGADNPLSDNSSVQKKKVKTQISLAAYKARKKQIEDSKVSDLSSSENPLVSGISMDIDKLKDILQTTNPGADNSGAMTNVGTISTVKASQILDKFDRIPDVQTHLANFDVSNLKMILETAKTPTETPMSPGFSSQEPHKSDKNSVKNGSESNSNESAISHEESQTTISERTRSDEQSVFSSSLRNKTEDQIIFFPNVKSDVKISAHDQCASSATMLTKPNLSHVKEDELLATERTEENVTDNSFFSHVKSEGEFSSDRNKIPGLNSSPSEESENMDTDLVKQNVSSGSSDVSDSKSGNGSVETRATSPVIASESTPFKNKDHHSLGEGLDNKISPIMSGEQLDDSDLGNISCEGSLGSHTSLSDPLNSSPIKSFSEFHHLTPKQLKTFIDSQTQLMKHYKEKRDVKTSTDRKSTEEKKKQCKPNGGCVASPLTISGESSSQKSLDNVDSQKSYLADVSSQESVFKSKPKTKPKVKPNKDMMGYRRRRRRKKTKKSDVTDDMDMENISITSTTSSEYLWQDDNFDQLSDRSWITPTPSECAEVRHCRHGNAQAISDYQLSHWTQAATRPDFQPRVVLTDVRKRASSLSTGSDISWKVSSSNSTVELEQEGRPASGKDLQLDTDDMYTTHTEERVKQWIQVARKKIKLTLKPVKKEEEEKSEKLKEDISVIPVLGTSQIKTPSSQTKQDPRLEDRNMSEDRSSDVDSNQKSEYLSLEETSVAVREKSPSSQYPQSDQPTVPHYVEAPGFDKPSSTYDPAVTAVNPTVTTSDPAVTSYNPTISTYDPAVTAYNPSVSTFDPAVTAYNPTVSTYDPAVTAYNPTVSTYNPAVTAYNPTVSTYDPAVTAYNPTVSTYDPAVTAYNSTVSLYNPAVTTYEPTVTTYDPAVTAYNPTVTAYNPPVTAYSPVVTAYKSTVSNYNPTITAYNPPVTAYNPPVTAYSPAVTAYNPSATTHDPVVSTFNSSVLTYPSHTVTVSVPNQIFAQSPYGANIPAASTYPQHTMATTSLMPAYTPQMSVSTAQLSSYPPPGTNSMMRPCRPHDPGHGQLSSPLQPPPGTREALPLHLPGQQSHLQPPVDVCMPPHRSSLVDPRLQHKQTSLQRVIGEHISGNQVPISDVGRPPNPDFSPVADQSHHLPSASLQRPPVMGPQMASQALPMSHGSEIMVGMSSGGQRPYPQNTATNVGLGSGPARGPGPVPDQAGTPGVGLPQQFFRHPPPPPPQVHQPPPMPSTMPQTPPPRTSLPRQGHVQTRPNIPLPRPGLHVPGVSDTMVTKPPHVRGMMPPPGAPRGLGMPTQNIHPIRGPASVQGMNQPHSLSQQPPRQPVHIGNALPPIRQPLHVRPPIHPTSGHPSQPPRSSNAPPVGMPGNQIPTILRMQHQPQGNQYPVSGFPPPQNNSGLFRPRAFAPPGAPPGMHPSEHFTNTAPPFHQQPRMPHNFSSGYNAAPPSNPGAAPPVTTATTKRASDVMDWFTDKLAPKKSSSDTGDYGNKAGSANSLFDIAFSGTKTNTRPDHFLGISSQCMCTGTQKNQGPTGLKSLDGKVATEGVDEGKTGPEEIDKKAGRERHVTDEQKGKEEHVEELNREEGKEKKEDYEAQEEVDMEIETSSEEGNDTIIVMGEENSVVSKQQIFHGADAVKSNETVLKDEKTDVKNNSDYDKNMKNSLSYVGSSVDKVKDGNGGVEEYKQGSEPVTLKNMKPLLELLNGDGEVMTGKDSNKWAEQSRLSKVHPKLEIVPEKNSVQDTFHGETETISSIQKRVMNGDGNSNVKNSSLPTNDDSDGQIVCASKSTLKGIDNQKADVSSVDKNAKPEILPNSAQNEQQKSGSPTKSVLRSGDQFVPPVLLRRGLLKGVEADKLKHPVISKKSVTKEETYSVLRGASESSKETTDCVENSLKIRLTIGTANSTMTREHEISAREVVIKSPKEDIDDIFARDDEDSTSKMRKESSLNQATEDVGGDDINFEHRPLSVIDMLDAALERDMTENKRAAHYSACLSKTKPLALNETESLETKNLRFDKRPTAKSIYNAKTGAWTTKLSEERMPTEGGTGDLTPRRETCKPLGSHDELDTSFETESEREYNDYKEGSWPSQPQQYIDNKSRDTDSDTNVFDPKIGAWVNQDSDRRRSEERTEQKRDTVMYDIKRGTHTSSEEMSNKFKNISHIASTTNDKRRQGRSGSHGNTDVSDQMTTPQKLPMDIRDKENTTKLASSDNRTVCDTKTCFYKSRMGLWMKETITTKNKKQESTESKAWLKTGVKEVKELENKPTLQSEFHKTVSNSLSASKTRDPMQVGFNESNQNIKCDINKDSVLLNSENKADVCNTKLEKKNLNGADIVNMDTTSFDRENQAKLSPVKSVSESCMTQSRTRRKETFSSSSPSKRRKTSTVLKTGTISDLLTEKPKPEKSIAYQIRRSRPGRGRSTSYSSSEESSITSHRTWNYNFSRRTSWKRYSRSPCYSRRSRSRRRYSRSRSYSSERSRRRHSRSRSYSSESTSRRRYSRSRSYSSESTSRRGRSRSHSRSRHASRSRSRKHISRSPSDSSRSRSRRPYSRSPSSRSKKRYSRSPSYSTISSSSDRTAFSPRGSWRGHYRHRDTHASTRSKRSCSRSSSSPSYSSVSTVSEDIKPSRYQSRRRSRSRYSRSPSCSTISTSSLSSSPRTKNKYSPWVSSDSIRQPRYSKSKSSRFTSSQKSPETERNMNPTVKLDFKSEPDNRQQVSNDRKQLSSFSNDHNIKDISSSHGGIAESPYSQESVQKRSQTRKIDLDSGNRHLFRDKPPSDYSWSSYHLEEAGCNRCPSPRKDRKSKETTQLKQNLTNIPRISSPYSPSSPTEGCSGETSPVYSCEDRTRDLVYQKPSSALGRSPDRNASRMATRFPNTDRSVQMSSHSLKDNGKAKEDFPIKFLFKDKVTIKPSLSPERRLEGDFRSRQSVCRNRERHEPYTGISSRDRCREFSGEQIDEMFMGDKRNIQKIQSWSGADRELRMENFSLTTDINQLRYHKDVQGTVGERNIKNIGDQRKFDNFSLDYLAKTQEKIRKELKGLDGTGSPVLNSMKRHLPNASSEPSEEIRTVCVERKKPLVSYDSPPGEEEIDRGKHKDVVPDRHVRKEPPLFRDSFRQVCPRNDHEKINNFSDRSLDRRVVIKSKFHQKDDIYTKTSRSQDDIHSKDYRLQSDYHTGNTINTKNEQYKTFPEWKNPQPNQLHKRGNSTVNAAEEWSQLLGNKAVPDHSPGTRLGRPISSKPGHQGQGENFNDLLTKEQLRLDLVPVENVLSKTERTVTASNQAECINMCACSTSLPFSKNELSEELIKVTRSVEKLWKEPLEEIESMSDRLPKELEEFCIQSGLTQLELENSKVIPQARSAIIRQDIQQFEGEMKMRITQSNYFGVCSQRVPSELLTKQEERKFFSEEGMFLILCNPIPSKTYQKLSSLKKKLDELQDKIDLETKKGMSSLVRNLSTEKQLAREERKRQLFTFTGCLTKKRLNKMRVKERYYLRCYNYFRKEYGEAADEMFPYLRMCIEDSANHIAIMTKLRSEDKDEAAIVEEEKRKEREKIQRQRVLQGLMMDIRTVDSKLSDMYFSCDITENFPTSVKSVVQHVHQRVNSVAEFLSEELMSDEPNSGAVGRLRATHKFCLKAYEFVKKSLAEANNPHSTGKISGQEVEKMEYSDREIGNETEKISEQEERKLQNINTMERGKDYNETYIDDEMNTEMNDSDTSNKFVGENEYYEEKLFVLEKEVNNCSRKSYDFEKKIDNLNDYKSERERDDMVGNGENYGGNYLREEELKNGNFKIENNHAMLENKDLKEKNDNMEWERGRDDMNKETILDSMADYFVDRGHLNSDRKHYCFRKELNNLLGSYDCEQPQSPIEPRESKHNNAFEQGGKNDDMGKEDSHMVQANSDGIKESD